MKFTLTPFSIFQGGDDLLNRMGLTINFGKELWNGRFEKKKKRKFKVRQGHLFKHKRHELQFRAQELQIEFPTLNRPLQFKLLLKYKNALKPTHFYKNLNRSSHHFSL